MAILGEWLKEEKAIKELWDSRKVGVPLWVAFGILSLYWLYRVPPPGYAIGVLAVVAGVMSVRDMKTLAKVSWIALLVFLLITEFRAIDKDRTENQTAQKAFFEVQQKGFSGIAAQASSNFATTNSVLANAIQGLNQNLQVANRTLLQTQPHALMSSSGFRVENAPVPPATFTTDVDYIFNFAFMNSGNKEAYLTRRLGRIYVAKPDDIEAQAAIVEQFDKDWAKIPRIDSLQKILPQAPVFWTEHRTFTPEEIHEILFAGNTVYGVSRVEYDDPSGRWWSERCDHYQISGNKVFIEVFHSCLVLMNDRYPAKQR